MKFWLKKRNVLIFLTVFYLCFFFINASIILEQIDQQNYNDIFDKSESIQYKEQLENKFNQMINTYNSKEDHETSMSKRFFYVRPIFDFEEYNKLLKVYKDLLFIAQTQQLSPNAKLRLIRIKTRF